MNAEQARSIGRMAKVYLKERRTDVLLLVFVLLLTAWSRILTMQPIENGGDPLDYWFFVKTWSHHLDFSTISWNHHRARLGIHWIVWVVQQVFGENPKYYFVAPLAASVLVSGLLFVLVRAAVGRSTLGRAAGIVAVLLLLEFDPFVTASSQLRPAIFGCAYVLLTMLSLVLYMRATDERMRKAAIVAIALFTFGGYMSVETSVFFVPGTLLAMWLSRRSWRDCAIVCALLLAGVAAETLLLQSTGGESRLKAVEMRGIGYRTGSYWTFLERLTTHLTVDSYKLVLYVFLLAGPAVITLSANPVARLAAFQGLVFLFVVVLVPRAISPLRPMLPMRDRYFDVVVPFALISNVTLATIISRRAIEQLADFRLLRARFSELRLGAFFVRQRAAFCLAFAALLTGGYVAKTWVENGSRLKAHPFVETGRLYNALSDAYARRLPIVAKADMKGKGAPRARNLHWAFNGFIRSDLLVDENGRLGDYFYERHTRGMPGGKVFMPPSLASDVAARYASANPRCVINLSARTWPGSAASFVKSSSLQKLPKECVAPKGR